jgi:hypothetical protein
VSDRENITLPRELVEKAIKAFENGCPPTCENGMIDSGGFHPWGEPMLDICPACLAFEHLRARLAAPEPVRVEPTPRITRITCGFVDVRFDGERWFCGKCGDRMSDRYEEMVKHSNEKDYLELMQRKAAFKRGRDKS